VPPGLESIRLFVGDVATLIGFQVSRDSVGPGEKVLVSLLWESNRPTSQDFDISLRLSRSDSTRASVAPAWMQLDAAPCKSAFPTSKWQPGERIWDEHALALPDDTPDGEYLVSVGWLDKATGLPATIRAASTTAEVPALGDYGLLARLKVVRQP
jgi:hypothetical protein